MMRRRANRRYEEPGDAILDILQRLWQTKLGSIELIEKWASETEDTEIKAGLTNHLVDERRHARMIGEEIRRRGGRIYGRVQKDALTRVFDEARANGEDLERLFSVYMGIKAYTVDRCAHMAAYTDPGLAQVLERITTDEEGHIRWADVRVQRLLTHEKIRECNLILGRIWSHLETAWEKQWRNLSQASLDRPGA